jgi:hypothetical protein
MKIRDLFERKMGKITKHAQQSSVGINAYGDGEQISADYTSFKLGQAMAMADGSKNPLDMDAKSWHGKRKTVQPFSPLEQQMFIQAANAVGADFQDLNNGDLKSKELDDTYTQSPVSNWNSKPSKKR